MAHQRRLTSIPNVQWGLGVAGAVLVTFFYLRRDGWALKPLAVDQGVGFSTFAAVALALAVADWILAKQESALTDKLYDFVGDVGALTTQGEGVESAIVTTLRSRKGAASRFFNGALRDANAQGLAFASALEHRGVSDGRPQIVQVSALSAAAIASGGAVGRMLSSLAQRLAKLRQIERKFASSLNGKILTLRFFANVLFPILFAGVATQQAYGEGIKWGAIFYLSVSLRMMTVDRLRLNSWKRAFAVQPFWLLITTLSLNAGYTLAKDHAISDYGEAAPLPEIPTLFDLVEKIKSKDILP